MLRLYMDEAVDGRVARSSLGIVDVAPGFLHCASRRFAGANAKEEASARFGRNDNVVGFREVVTAEILRRPTGASG